ncbi:MAG: hypothetical protein HFJ74_00045 [Eggerthellaceae bacterium]|jgi:hypothetical protein|nr:hypothetical protein [Eggerthellaceae bacterium]
MAEMSFMQLRDLQHRIIENKAILSSRIGYVDEHGHRKLDPKFFLSGEVAAYKLLNTWEKAMMRGDNSLASNVQETLEQIEALCQYSQQDFANPIVLHDYERLSAELWMKLFDVVGIDDSMHDINVSIGIMSALFQYDHEIPVEELEYIEGIDKAEYTDSVRLARAYSHAHRWFMEARREEVEQMMAIFRHMHGKDLHKIHFDLFQ